MKHNGSTATSLQRPRIAALLLGIVSSVLLLLVFDLGAYFILDLKVPGSKPERFFVFSPVLGSFHRPNSEGYWYRYNDGTKYYGSINHYGFADSERVIKKTRPRIALIGDSTTEFWETDVRNRGQYQLEKFLDYKFEVLNLGVRGYGTDQTYLLFETVGVHFAPDIVIYTFCINDINDNVTTRSKPYFTLAPSEPSGLALTGYPSGSNRTESAAWRVTHSSTEN